MKPACLITYLDQSLWPHQEETMNSMQGSIDAIDAEEPVNNKYLWNFP